MEEYSSSDENYNHQSLAAKILADLSSPLDVRGIIGADSGGEWGYTDAGHLLMFIGKYRCIWRCLTYWVSPVMPNHHGYCGCSMCHPAPHRAGDRVPGAMVNIRKHWIRLVVTTPGLEKKMLQQIQGPQPPKATWIEQTSDELTRS